MDILNHTQKLSVMRVLLDIIYADGRIDYRESDFFYQLTKELGLDGDCIVDELKKKSAILSLLDIKEMSLEQKRQFASLMDKTIKIDNDIDVNEVAIYDVVIDYCGIPIPFSNNDQI